MDTNTREQLTNAARACRILEMEGHGDMTLGHMSLRDPSGTGFWMKRNRIGLGEVLGPDDFILCNFDGKQLEGSGGRHSEWPIHSEILRARPDVNVVVHSHPFHACVFSAAVEPLLPYTVDGDYFETVPRHEDDVALVTLKSEGEALARSLGDAWVVLMGNHGVTFCGATIEQAVCVGVFIEKACKAHLTGHAANLKTKMPTPAVRARRHGQVMTPVHWEHSWNYFCRKLKALTESQGGREAVYR